ncbi:hypothetical protein F2P81_006198 [Scophthalmus maximus]|uniref:Leucine-rich repeat-containing protein 40 n=1 Tax=Scophthalmus maximus TaxID=52904 RepID=A0A6A4T513_SCOMX|nr:hypothetical protein F2P81_006198 [Scophthalmus maximus]
MSLQIQRAHRALAQKPAHEATSRFIVINFLQFAVKETVLKLAWMKKVHINNKQILCDHDYAYEMMQKHRARADRVDSLAGFRTEKTEPAGAVPHGLLKAARKSGQLNLSGRGLTEDFDEHYYDTLVEIIKKRFLIPSNLKCSFTVKLHDNQLSSLPCALGELQELQQLRVSHNQLTSLPAETCTLKNLCVLTMQQNLLENLPEELGQLENLTELDLSNNQLEDLPSSLGRLTRLQKLNLCGNKLSCLPDSLAQLTNVKLLDCSRNQLTDIPASLSEMLALEQLYLRHNKLRLLPQLPAPALKELYVGNNHIERVDTEQLACLAAISLLELRDNKIQTLPEQITLLSTLTRLDLTNNDITTNKSLCTIRTLRSFQWFHQKGTNELLKYLRGRIKEEPERPEDGDTAMTLPSQSNVNVHNIKSLKLLVYRNNQLIDLPPDMKNLTKLRSVILSYNR